MFQNPQPTHLEGKPYTPPQIPPLTQRFAAATRDLARYSLLNLLLRLSRDEKAQTLLRECEGEWRAGWLYTRALLAFREGGASGDPLPRPLPGNPDEALNCFLDFLAELLVEVWI